MEAFIFAMLTFMLIFVPPVVAEAYYERTDDNLLAWCAFLATWCVIAPIIILLRTFLSTVYL